MNATPRQLVLLMSAVGFGLAFADAAVAHESARDRAAKAIAETINETIASDASADAKAEAPAAARVGAAPSVALVVTTPSPALVVEAQRAAPLSGGLDDEQALVHDRHAVALALVLMADPGTPALPRIAPSRSAWAGAIARHLEYAAPAVALPAPWLDAGKAPGRAGLPAAAEEWESAAADAAALATDRSGLDDGESSRSAAAVDEPTDDAATELARPARTGTDASVEAAVEATIEASVETTIEASVEATVEASVDETVAATVATTVDTPADTPIAPIFEPTAVAAVAAAPASLAPSTVEYADIVIASHADQVLMSLAALKAPGDARAGKFGAQPRTTVVARRADQVLLDLASVRERRPASPAVPTPRREAPIADSSRAVSPFDGQTLAVSSDTLDGVRGGFVTPSGLQISFGIERAVYLNGEVVATTRLTLNELGKVSGAHGLPVSAELGRALVQNGAGNTVVPSSISASALGTVIQNTLDNQKIQTITKIDAAVSAATVLRSMDLQSSMRGAISQSLQR